MRADFVIDVGFEHGEGGEHRSKVWGTAIQTRTAPAMPAAQRPRSLTRLLAGGTREEARSSRYEQPGAMKSLSKPPPRRRKPGSWKQAAVVFGVLAVGLALALFERACDKGHAAAPAVEGATYTCPMHPEVVSDKPGNCPKCGMMLEARPSGSAQGLDAGGGTR
jgi:hypothetical protein